MNSLLPNCHIWYGFAAFDAFQSMVQFICTNIPPFLPKCNIPHLSLLAYYWLTCLHWSLRFSLSRLISALMNRWPIVVKSCWADYKKLIWAITSCFLPLRVWIFFLLWLWFSPELIVLHLKLNLCVERWNCQHHWIDDQLFLNWSKTGYNQLTWTITFVFPVTII